MRQHVHHEGSRLGFEVKHGLTGKISARGNLAFAQYEQVESSAPTPTPRRPYHVEHLHAGKVPNFVTTDLEVQGRRLDKRKQLWITTRDLGDRDAAHAEYLVTVYGPTFRVVYDPVVAAAKAYRKVPAELSVSRPVVGAVSLSGIEAMALSRGWKVSKARSRA